MNSFVSTYILLHVMFIRKYLLIWRKHLISTIMWSESIFILSLTFFSCDLGICNSSPPNKPAETAQSSNSSSFLNFGMYVTF